MAISTCSAEFFHDVSTVLPPAGLVWDQSKSGATCNHSAEIGVVGGVMEPTDIALRVAAMRLPSQVVTPSSFDELFVHEVEPMIRLAISLVDTRERAEEIVQDAFEKTLMAWRRLDRPGAYLRLAVINGCRSELRRRRVVRGAPNPTADDRLSSPADSDMLDALRRLTPKRRIALTLRFYADLPEAEIAELMGVRLGTVKSLVSRGLADLRKVVTR